MVTALPKPASSLIIVVLPVSSTWSPSYLSYFHLHIFLYKKNWHPLFSHCWAVPCSQLNTGTAANSYKRVPTNGFPILIQTWFLCWVVFQSVEPKSPVVVRSVPKTLSGGAFEGRLAALPTPKTFPNINESELFRRFPLRFTGCLFIVELDSPKLHRSGLKFFISGYRRKTIHRSSPSALALHPWREHSGRAGIGRTNLHGISGNRWVKNCKT